MKNFKIFERISESAPIKYARYRSTNGFKYVCEIESESESEALLEALCCHYSDELFSEINDLGAVIAMNDSIGRQVWAIGDTCAEMGDYDVVVYSDEEVDNAAGME